MSFVKLQCRSSAPLCGDGESFTVKFEYKYTSDPFLLVSPRAFMLAWQLDSLAEMGGFKKANFFYQYITQEKNCVHLSPEFKSIELFDEKFKKQRLDAYTKHSLSPPDVSCWPDGTLGISNGRHRARLLYACGIEKMPLLIKPDEGSRFLERLDHIERCLSNGEPLPASPVIYSRWENNALRQKEILFQERIRYPEEIFLEFSNLENLSIFSQLQAKTL